MILTTQTEKICQYSCYENITTRSEKSSWKIHFSRCTYTCPWVLIMLNVNTNVKYSSCLFHINIWHVCQIFHVEGKWKVFYKSDTHWFYLIFKQLYIYTEKWKDLQLKTNAHLFKPRPPVGHLRQEKNHELIHLFNIEYAFSLSFGFSRITSSKTCQCKKVIDAIMVFKKKKTMGCT